MPSRKALESVDRREDRLPLEPFRDHGQLELRVHVEVVERSTDRRGEQQSQHADHAAGLGVVHRRDQRVPIRRGVDEADLGETTHRLPHRRTRNAEGFGELGVLESFTGSQVAGDDAGQEDRVDIVSEEAPVCRERGEPRAEFFEGHRGSFPELSVCSGIFIV